MIEYNTKKCVAYCIVEKFGTGFILAIWRIKI